MTTAARGGAERTFLDSVKFYALREWKTLARMRTAVILLAIIAGLSIIATLLPQKALQPEKASAYLQAHQQLGPLWDRLGLFSVYESWPLVVAAVLMYTSLSNCVYTRGRALYRRWRRGLPRNHQFIGEAGSLVFHLSFFVLLFGVLYGKAAGFSAFVNVIEGQSVVEARPSYDQIEEGVLFGAGQHKGYEVRVDSFNASYYANGKPQEFVSHVEVFDGGRKVMQKDIRVNDYLEYRGVKFYQASYGWSPVLQVTDPTGKTVFNGPINFFGDPQLQNGILKVPAAGPPGQQLGALMFMVPDLQQGPNGARAGSANPNNPAVLFRFFKGDLQAARAQNVNELDTTRMSEIWTGGVLLGQSVGLPGGYRVSFPQLLRYTGLQATDDPGVPVIWFSFALMLGGLMVRLYLAPLLQAREARARRRVAQPREGVAAAIGRRTDANTPLPVDGGRRPRAPGAAPQSTSG
ncbi:MAG TPA: cytochrome c biogenesis protein ResB [Candidatus Solibacter sp.]|jgi:cytochrome c biogenesis protein|nr:cytochrome c biogenesis protein ResB [Candidatus Solibacter sp.]